MSMPTESIHVASQMQGPAGRPTAIHTPTALAPTLTHYTHSHTTHTHLPHTTTHSHTHTHKDTECSARTRLADWKRKKQPAKLQPGFVQLHRLS